MDKELLFKPLFPEADVPVPGRGTVRIRSLSRREIHEMPRDDPGEAERHMVAAAMLDPKLTVDEVARWQEASGAGEISVVVEAIGKLSGLGDDAAKEAYKSVR